MHWAGGPATAVPYDFPPSEPRTMTDRMATSTDQPGSMKRRTPSAPNGGAATEGLRAQGLRTRNAIVRVARKLLLEGGSLEFSLRAVAQRAGVSISNLQYYFPTRLAVV